LKNTLVERRREDFEGGGGRNTAWAIFIENSSEIIINDSFFKTADW
jgi:hypothetical protein